ncbi:MAG: trypsin-like peptidase domain-containing protein [Pirellulaceae bacterium]
MKQPFSKYTTVALLACSMFLGTCAATWISPNATSSVAAIAVAETSDVQPLTNALSPAVARPDVESGQLVQEPPRRSSYRPDFSRGLRRSNQRSNFFMLRAFQDAVGDSWKSTVRLNTDGKQVAMGAIVGSEGWVITKASELPISGEVQCRLYDGSFVDADVVNRVVDIDLALLRIDRDNLPVVSWATDIPERGRWLATTDVQASVPTAVGVVSAGAQRVNRSNAVLGVHLKDSSDGAEVTLVLPGSGAYEAGLRSGDSIFAVNGEPVQGHSSFQKVVKDGIGGQVVKLSYKRANTIIETEGRLMDLADELLDETEMEVNGRISARASGFNRVFTHDTVLDPNQCGGPLVNLDGQVVGINIARAGRVSSYALPADVVRPVVDSLIEQAKVVSHSADPRTSLRPIR